MEICINLNNQRNLKKSKKTLIILSCIALLFSIGTFAGLFFESTLLFWLYAFYFLIIAISLFFQSKGKHLFDLIGKSYLKINDVGIIFKNKMLDPKIVQYNWDDVEELEIKLFEIELKSKNKWITVNLEKLSDDNLKSVKQVFKDFRANLSNRIEAV